MFRPYEMLGNLYWVPDVCPRVRRHRLRNQSQHMKAITLLTASFLMIVGITACKRSPAARLRGDYVNQFGPKATLKVTADTMICSASNSQIKERVIEVNGNVVTTELSVPPSTSKVTVDIQVLDDALVVTNNFLYGGNWKRQK